MTSARTAKRKGRGGDRPMRLLLLSNMYPARDNPMYGAFIAKQEAALRELGVPYRHVVNTRWRLGVVNNVRKYASMLVRSALAGILRGFDVVVGHYLYPTAWFAHLAAEMSGKPYVLVVHGTDVRSVQRRDPFAWRARAALPKASLVVCVSDAIEHEVREELHLPPYVPTAVVNMGVDRDLFHPVAGAREKLGLPADARIVLFAGNFIRRKNVEVLIPAFDRALKEGAVDMLLLAGGDPEGRREMAEREVAERGIAGDVRFLGVLEPHDLAMAMSAADVFVLPSVFEANGVVLMEAMACGTPVVASAVGGIPEIVSPECGRLVASDDVDGFAEAIGEVVSLGKAHFADGCERAAAANDVVENTRRLLGAIEHVVGGER